MPLTRNQRQRLRLCPVSHFDSSTWFLVLNMQVQFDDSLQLDFVPSEWALTLMQQWVLFFFILVKHAHFASFESYGWSYF